MQDMAKIMNLGRNIQCLETVLLVLPHEVMLMHTLSFSFNPYPQSAIELKSLLEGIASPHLGPWGPL